MIERRRRLDRIGTTVGMFCLVASVLLLSTGVRTVRAEGGDMPPASPDPVLETRLEAPTIAPAAAIEGPAEAGTAPQPIVSEVEPEVIVLNTRGYNYGPSPGGIDLPVMGRDASSTLPKP